MHQQQTIHAYKHDMLVLHPWVNRAAMTQQLFYSPYKAMFFAFDLMQ